MWVLILTVFWYHAPAITTQEFTSEQTCQVALQQATKVIQGSDGEQARFYLGAPQDAIRGICVKK